MLKGLRFAVSVIFSLFIFAVFAGAEPRIDVYFGMGTMSDGAANPVADTNGNIYSRPSLDGVFGTFGGALMFRPSFGVGAEVAVRFSQGDYAIYGYRPVFYDFNAIWTPSLGRYVMPEFQGGFGGVSTSFYDASSPYYDYYTGRYSTLAARSKHLQLHAGAGLRIYVKGRIFVRPQLDYHWVRNMWEFKDESVLSYSLAIGWSSSE